MIKMHITDARLMIGYKEIPVKSFVIETSECAFGYVDADKPTPEQKALLNRPHNPKLASIVRRH